MTKYKCPYCSEKYNLHIKRKDGVMICGHCGDELLKIPFIRPVQIFGLISLIAFASPLILMFTSIIQIEIKKQLSPSELILQGQ
tara:strand:+ start:72 stop:323 length:252 start_codon:yes stop_codon:yes gene_type:complete